jgi:DNA-binding transcriptional ArsR family regulator
MPPDIEAIAEQVFVALADPSRRAILATLAARGPATATDLAERLPITRQAIAKHLALLSDAGLVTAQPGERRRVRYRVRSAPMRVAQQFMAALARDWDGSLDALQEHLDQSMKGKPDNEDTSDCLEGRMGSRTPAAAREGEGGDARP